ncbi:tetratricopeptide repeat protein [Thiohalophilus sp.]|uniref:tetratricopeptide repeat protein n=1 Tax=Thiohalophilus sp. TaxID=3028392 RepID=UPI003975DF89
MRLLSIRFLLPCLLGLFVSVASAGPLEEGRQAYEASNYEQARKLWEPLAAKNDPDALFNIGLLYMQGKGVKQDARTAMEWFKQAAQYGSVDAAYNLGMLYADGRGVYPSPKDAIYWWRQAAEVGHAESQYNLGVMLAYGRGTTRQLSEALTWWEAAARQGNANAIRALAMTYEQGMFDIAPDPEQAQQWRQLLGD